MGDASKHGRAGRLVVFRVAEAAWAQQGCGIWMRQMGAAGAWQWGAAVGRGR